MSGNNYHPLAANLYILFAAGPLMGLGAGAFYLLDLPGGHWAGAGVGFILYLAGMCLPYFEGDPYSHGPPPHL